MPKQTVLAQKRRGPPPTGKGHTIGVRVQPDLMTSLDTWISRQPKPQPSRPEAIRQILAKHLKRSK
jgi:hypothetical protein